MIAVGLKGIFYVNITQNWYAFYNKSMIAVGLKGFFYVNITQNW